MKSLLTSALLLLISFNAIPAQEQPLPTEDDYYPLVKLPIPEGVVLEAGGVELLESGKLAVSSRRGDIYLVENPFETDVSKIKFQLYAQGLHEVLGLESKGDWIFATQRGEVTRLRDTDGDAAADEILTLNDDWEINGDYHEYAFGSKFDKNGDHLGCPLLDRFIQQSQQIQRLVRARHSRG